MTNPPLEPRSAEATEAVDAAAESTSPDRESEKGSTEACQEARKKVKHQDLLNLLNYINFREGRVFASFKHRKYGNHVSFQATPGSCTEESLECRWLPPGLGAHCLDAYDFEDLLLSDGYNLVVVKAEVLRMDGEGIAFTIPEFGYEGNCRKVRRHPSHGIGVQVIQNGLRYEGSLLDFNAISFKVELANPQHPSLHWMNPASPVTVILQKGDSLLYSSECLITRFEPGPLRRSIVLAPTVQNIRRYKSQGYRSLRHSLTPRANVRFLHPITGKTEFLQAKDISSTGLCVEEFFENSVLLPGLIIPELSIEIANDLLATCTAQVLYRTAYQDEHGQTLASCGIVLLDMNLQDQARLCALLHQSINDRMRVGNKLDVDELWRLFFESGFVYPSKYRSIQADKEELKDTYGRLYLESPSIARHFTFQDKGLLFGHMSMIHFYAKAWVIHHHAAARSGYGMAGLAVLDQVGYYINEFHRPPSTHMDYVMCYYRTENKFPRRVFGGVARDIADLKGSSQDAFAYLHLPAGMGGSDSSYQLFPTRHEDRAELRLFYEHASAGLMLDALNLQPDEIPESELEAEYARQGFKKERHVFSLKQEGKLKAVILLTLSDLGLNLSNLTNCMHVVVVDPEALSPKTLFAALRELSRNYAIKNLPLLVYPAEYLDRNSIACEKKYILWVLNMEYTDGYFASLDNTFRRIRGGRRDCGHEDG